MNTKQNVQIRIQHSHTADLPTPPAVDNEWHFWSESPDLFLRMDGGDNRWVHKSIKKYLSAIETHPSHWWRIVITWDEGVQTTKGFITTGASKLLVVAGPDRFRVSNPEGMPSFPVDDEHGYYILNVKLPEGLIGDEYLGNQLHEDSGEDVPVAGQEHTPGEDVEEESEETTQNVVAVNEDGTQSVGTLHHSQDTIPSGTEVQAVDEFGRQYTVTVL